MHINWVIYNINICYKISIILSYWICKSNSSSVSASSELLSEPSSFFECFELFLHFYSPLGLAKCFIIITHTWYFIHKLKKCGLITWYFSHICDIINCWHLSPFKPVVLLLPSEVIWRKKSRRRKMSRSPYLCKVRWSENILR